MYGSPYLGFESLLLRQRLRVNGPRPVSSGAFLWKGGRVVEGGGLENHCAGNRTRGSNPCPSAIRRRRRSQLRRDGTKMFAGFEAEGARGRNSPSLEEGVTGRAPGVVHTVDHQRGSHPPMRSGVGAT